MALTPSTMLELGTRAPDFALPDTEGNTVTRDGFVGKPLQLTLTPKRFVELVRKVFAIFRHGLQFAL